MSNNIWEQNKICRFCGIRHPEESVCSRGSQDPEVEPTAPVYEVGEGKDSAGREVDHRGKLVKDEPSRED